MLVILMAYSAHASLDVFGNANMDDVVDQSDIDYIDGIINGSTSQVLLADSNNDGTVDQKDIDAITKIINGTAETITVVDQINRTVTLKVPVEKVVSLANFDSNRVLLQLGVADRIVGISSDSNPMTVKAWDPTQEVAPWIGNLTELGKPDDPSLEQILSLKPDLIIMPYIGEGSDAADIVQDKTGIPVVTIAGYSYFDFDMYRLMGMIMGKEEKAQALIDYANDKLAAVTEITSQIPGSDKPLVYFVCASKTITTKARVLYPPIDLAGGDNIAKEIAITTPWACTDISKEQIIAWNPEIILLQGTTNYTAKDVMADPDLKTVDAVKNGRIYRTRGTMYGWDPAVGIVETLYLAKLFYPEKFSDLDIDAEGNEILEAFYGADGLYTTMAEKYDLYRWN